MTIQRLASIITGVFLIGGAAAGWVCIGIEIARAIP
jgi:hypothetical protein